MRGREVSLVRQPANPEARFRSIPVSTENLSQALGSEFRPGIPVSCDKCLGRCWGFDELPEQMDRNAPQGTIVDASLTDDGEVDMVLAIPDDRAAGS